jgi:hypothetical protein
LLPRREGVRCTGHLHNWTSTSGTRTCIHERDLGMVILLLRTIVLGTCRPVPLRRDGVKPGTTGVLMAQARRADAGVPTKAKEENEPTLRTRETDRSVPPTDMLSAFSVQFATTGAVCMQHAALCTVRSLSCTLLPRLPCVALCVPIRCFVEGMHTEHLAFGDVLRSYSIPQRTVKQTKGSLPSRVLSFWNTCCIRRIPRLL